MWSVGTLFRARGIDATVGVQRSASTAPVPKGTPSALLSPHSPRARTRASRCRPPPLPGVSLRSRSACAAQQGRPTPVPLKRRKKSAKEEKLCWGVPLTRSRKLSFQTSRPPQQSELESNMHHREATNPFTRLAASTHANHKKQGYTNEKASGAAVPNAASRNHLTTATPRLRGNPSTP